MSRIVCLQNENVTTINLNQLMFWRLMIDATAMYMKDQRVMPCFSLCLRYPPGGHTETIALARATCPVADTIDELSNVTRVVLEGGTLDKDQDRTREAFNVFKNKMNIKGDILERCVEDAKSIVELYWIIKNWVREGMKQDRDVSPLPGILLLLRGSSVPVEPDN